MADNDLILTDKKIIGIEKTQDNKNKSKYKDTYLAEKSSLLSGELKILIKCIKLKGINNLEIKTEIKTVISKLYEKKDFKSIHMYTDYETILYCNDSDVFKMILEAYLKNNDFNNALFISAKIYFSAKISKPLKQISEIYYRKLSLDEINGLIENKKYDEALNYYNILTSKVDDDTEIQIVGAGILIYMGDWAGAEYLIKEINDPGIFYDRLNRLKVEINRLKTIEKRGQQIENNKIIIPFTLINNSILVKALVNDYLEQEFIIDTGASMTSIPPDALETLGVYVPFEAPIRKITTAGGVVYAREIKIDSINLNGCVVNNLNVLDLNLPDQSHKGLLGMNFLNNFHVEINHSDKVLILSKK